MKDYLLRKLSFCIIVINGLLLFSGILIRNVKNIRNAI